MAETIQLGVTWDNVFEATSQYATFQNVTDKITCVDSVYSYSHMKTYKLRIKIYLNTTSFDRTIYWIINNNKDLVGRTRIVSLNATKDDKTKYYSEDGYVCLDFSCCGGVMKVLPMIGDTRYYREEDSAYGGTTEYHEVEDGIESIIFTIRDKQSDDVVEVFSIPRN